MGPLAIWTERVWQSDSSFLRWVEKSLMRGVDKWVLNDDERAARKNHERFVKPLLPPEAIEKQSHLFSRLWDSRRDK